MMWKISHANIEDWVASSIEDFIKKEETKS